MTPIRILGIGSPLGDDRVGWYAIDVIESSGILAKCPKGRICAEKCDRPGSLLLYMMQGAQAVIIIDAVQSGSEPGTLHRLYLQDLDDVPFMLSSHGFGVASALSLASALGDLPEQVIIYGIEIEYPANAEQSDELRLVLQDALVSLAPAIKSDLINWCAIDK